MRKFCLFICISLLSSLLHAVTMPVETSHAPVANVVAAHEHHACDEAPDNTPAPTCNLSGHVCCLGITAATHTALSANVYGVALLNPVFQTLVLQDHPNKQFKPPKAHLQS
jgi:hypothetical protein